MVLLLLAGMLAFPAWAWPFGNSDKPTTSERVVGRLGKDKAAQFQEGVRRRQLRAEEIAVLGRLIDEKQGEWHDFGETMRQQFAVSASQTYTFNSTNLTLYLVLTNGIAGSSPENPVLRPHHAFPSEEDASEFLQLVAARNLTAGQIATFQGVLAEKRAEYKLIANYLDKNFGVKADKKYRFDVETGELIEVVPIPSAAQARQVRETKQREAEAENAKQRAEAEARAAAEKKAKAERERVEKLAAEKAEAERKAAERRARLEAEAREAAEKKAKADRERAERLAAEKAKQEAEARAAAEKKAKADRERAERLAAEKAKQEAEARAAAEKKAKAEAFAAAVAAETRRLGAERGQALEVARLALSEAGRGKLGAEAALKAAERDYAWIRANKKGESGLIAAQKKRIAAAEKAIDAADDAVSAAKKRVKAAERDIARIAEDAENNVKAAQKAGNK